MSTEPRTHAEGKSRWGQERRLAFIDLRLQFDGRINRGDLTAFFKISSPQASQDLARYSAVAPGNLTYDSSSKMFVAASSYTPYFGETDTRAYLAEMAAVAAGVIGRDRSFIGFLPDTGIVSTPSRPLHASAVANFIHAIRDKLSLELDYQSMRSPEPVRRVISPHALGFDGLRWHVRAYCHLRKIYRDFAMGRARNVSISDVPTVRPEEDAEWLNTVTILLTPHPKLSPSQRDVVEHDYGMQSGKPLEVPCRQAMLFYTLRHLNLESLEIHDDPARQHVVIGNREDVQAWLTDVSSL